MKYGHEPFHILCLAISRLKNSLAGSGRVGTETKRHGCEAKRATCLLNGALPVPKFKNTHIVEITSYQKMNRTIRKIA